MVEANPVAFPRGIRSLQLGLGWFPESPGGLDRFYFELADALPQVGVEAFGLLVGSAAAESATGGRVRAFAAASDPLPSRLAAARSAVGDAIRQRRPDVVASHFALYTIPALGRLKGLPLVVHFQGPWAQESRVEGAGRVACLAKRLLERSVYRRADRLICLSSAFAEILSRSYGVQPDRIRVVPGAIEVNRFDVRQSRADARDRLGWHGGRPIVLCVRRLARRMGLENLVEAAVLLRNRVPDALVLIAGRGAMAGRLSRQIASAGLDETVKLLGFVPDGDLPLAYRAADLTVVPSTELEGFGLVAAESLAAGTPALVSPVGGLPDVVRGLTPDWVLPDTSAARLADGLAAALTGGLRAVPPERCAAYARENFDWSIIAARVAAVYAEALGVSNSQTVATLC